MFADSLRAGSGWNQFYPDPGGNDTHIGTRYVILAKHWMWLPDDDFM